MDAVRWTLVMLTTEGQDIRLSEDRFEGGRNFVNKLWNASRFVLMNLDGYDPDYPAKITAPEDRWLQSQLAQLVDDVTEAMQGHRFHEMGQKLYAFTWNVFCDWYLELAKGRLNDDSEAGEASRRAAHAVLTQTLETLLRLLHPIIPHVTEEIASHLRSTVQARESLLVTSRWPEPNPEARILEPMSRSST